MPRDQVAIFGDLIGRFTAEVLEHLDMSERTLQRVIKRASIAPDVRARLSSTPFARNGSELDALVKLGDAALQRAAVTMVFSGEADAQRTMAAAASTLSGKREVVRSDADVQFAALMKGWKTAGAQARRRFIDDLVADGDPIIVALIESEREAA